MRKLKLAKDYKDTLKKLRTTMEGTVDPIDFKIGSYERHLIDSLFITDESAVNVKMKDLEPGTMFAFTMDETKNDKGDINIFLGQEQGIVWAGDGKLLRLAVWDIDIETEVIPMRFCKHDSRKVEIWKGYNSEQKK